MQDAIMLLKQDRSDGSRAVETGRGVGGKEGSFPLPGSSPAGWEAQRGEPHQSAVMPSEEVTARSATALECVRWSPCIRQNRAQTLPSLPWALDPAAQAIILRMFPGLRLDGWETKNTTRHAHI